MRERPINAINARDKAGMVNLFRVESAEPYIKGKSAIHLARAYGERTRNFVGQNFWARGYFVSTVGRDEAVIREYIRNQEDEDKRLDQLKLWQ